MNADSTSLRTAWCLNRSVYSAEQPGTADSGSSGVEGPHAQTAVMIAASRYSSSFFTMPRRIPLIKARIRTSGISCHTTWNSAGMSRTMTAIDTAMMTNSIAAEPRSNDRSSLIADAFFP